MPINANQAMSTVKPNEILSSSNKISIARREIAQIEAVHKYI